MCRISTTEDEDLVDQLPNFSVHAHANTHVHNPCHNATPCDLWLPFLVLTPPLVFPGFHNFLAPVTYLYPKSLLELGNCSWRRRCVTPLAMSLSGRECPFILLPMAGADPCSQQLPCLPQLAASAHCPCWVLHEGPSLILLLEAQHGIKPRAL